MPDMHPLCWARAEIFQSRPTEDYWQWNLAMFWIYILLHICLQSGVYPPTCLLTFMARKTPPGIIIRSPVA
jgi:hypothetical protein